MLEQQIKNCAEMIAVHLYLIAALGQPVPPVRRGYWRWVIRGSAWLVGA